MKSNNRRKFIITSALLGLGITGSALSKSSKKQLVHQVFFTLKNPESKEDMNQLITGIKTLNKIETVNKLHVGVLASTEKRDVVDTSWDISELLFFDDLAAQSIYQTHPIHLEFIEKCNHLWSKVVVYDAIEV
jgi:hypothetical protein